MFGFDEGRNTVCAYAVFSGTHTGQGRSAGAWCRRPLRTGQVTRGARAISCAVAPASCRSAADSIALWPAPHDDDARAVEAAQVRVVHRVRDELVGHVASSGGRQAKRSIPAATTTSRAASTSPSSRVRRKDQPSRATSRTARGSCSGTAWRRKQWP
jgi:hypothetical protein